MWFGDDTVKRNNILVTLMGQRVNSSLESKRAEPACCAFAVLTHPHPVVEAFLIRKDNHSVDLNAGKTEDTIHQHAIIMAHKSDTKSKGSSS